jgi:hypothetical protein
MSELDKYGQLSGADGVRAVEEGIVVCGHCKGTGVCRNCCNGKGSCTSCTKAAGGHWHWNGCKPYACSVCGGVGKVRLK